MLTLVCLDVETHDTSVIYAPISDVNDAHNWLQFYLLDLFIKQGMDEELAQGRATDSEILAAFQGKVIPKFVK